MKILLVVFFIFSVQLGFTQTYTGDVNLLTQADVNEFGANEYTKIIGGLFIGSGLDSVSNIEDLTPLASIEEIDASEGFVALSLVEMPFYKTTFNEFPNLKYIVGNLNFTLNENIEVLNGFDNLNAVRGDLFIADNPSLKEVSGFMKLDTVYEFFNISMNPELTTISGFQGMESYYNGPEETTDLFIFANEKLLNINGFRNLKNGKFYYHY